MHADLPASADGVASRVRDARGGESRGTGARARRVALNSATALVLLTLAAVVLLEPVVRLVNVRRSRLGVQAASPADVVPDIHGGLHPLLARDSATLVLLLDPASGASRAQARSYLPYVRWGSLQGLAVRLVLPSDDLPGAAQFGRLAGDEGAFLLATRGWYEQLGLPDSPSAVLLDRAGRIRGRWPGAVPRHLEVLNVLGRMRR